MSDREWTIMIYMAGDNNLAVDMAYAMEQIKDVADAGAQSPNLFVYYDGNSPAIPTMYCDFSEPRKPRYVRSYKLPDKLYPVPQKENENAADRNSILNFVDWCLNKVEVENSDGEISFGRRAEKYALIFSGHTLGFQDIGLFKDETSGKSMKMNDFYLLLKGLVSTKKQLKENADAAAKWTDEFRKIETTVLIGQKLDILGFDSCVMGMLEVGYQFNDVAKTMIASEGSVPSAGWTYAKILGCLAREPELDTPKVAELFVKQFVRSQDAYTVGGVSVDMAAWDLKKFAKLAEAFNGLSEMLLECFKSEENRIYRQMARVILQVHWQCQSYMYDQNVDLGDFCELLDRECGLVIEELGGDEVDLLKAVQKECRNVLKQLKETVILSGFSGGGYQYSNGISVFFPWSREGYEVSRKNYESLWFTKEATQKRLSWTGFLKKYLYDVSLRKFEQPDADVPVGSRYKYYSGVKFDERAAAVAAAGNGASKTRIAGQEGTRMAGQEGTRIAGQEGTRIAGQEGTRIAGQEGTRIAGQEGTRIAGQEGTRIAGQEGTRIAGQEGTRIAGQEGTRIAGQEGTRIAGQEGTRIAGQEGTRIAGQEGTRIAGQEGSRIAGQEGSRLGGGGASGFFNSLKLFKNIESRWNVSGFTKKPDDPKTSDY